MTVDSKFSVNIVDILFLLIPLAALLAVVIAVVFLWAVRSGQFDDMEGPAHSILMDDDSIDTPTDTSSKNQ